MVLAALGVDDPSAELLEELDRPMAFTDIVQPFEDVRTHLERFRAEGWSIAIVADTGTAMRGVYKHYGLDDLVDVFVISGELGCTKPDPRMYRTASESLGLPPDSCFFVDDRAGNVQGALDLGYEACGMSRYSDPPADGGLWVRDLAELHALITPRRH